MGNKIDRSTVFCWVGRLTPPTQQNTVDLSILFPFIFCNVSAQLISSQLIRSNRFTTESRSVAP